jgi:hypothetical protein
MLRTISTVVYSQDTSNLRGAKRSPGRVFFTCLGGGGEQIGKFRSKCRLLAGLLDTDASMSLSIVVNAAFHAKSGVGADNSPETVHMNAADMKTLKAKTGSYVEALWPHSSALLQVWPSKKALSGSVTFNRAWQSNFQADQRKIKLVALASDT